MTIDDFLVELSKTQRTWKRDFKASLRTLDGRHCPITAVAENILQKPADLVQARTIGVVRLKMNSADCEQIMLAADCCKGLDLAIRLRLCRACGLAG